MSVPSASSIEERIDAILARRFSQIEATLAAIPMFVQGFTRFENTVLSLTQSAAAITEKLQVLNKSLVASQLALPHWKLVQFPPQVSPALQDLGLYQDRLMVCSHRVPWPRII